MYWLLKELSHSSHLGYSNKTTLAIMNLHFAPKQCFCSAKHMVQSEMPFEAFQDGCYGRHLRYQSSTILSILDLNAAPTPPTLFQFNLTSCLGSRCKRSSFRNEQTGHTSRTNI